MHTKRNQIRTPTNQPNNESATHRSPSGDSFQLCRLYCLYRFWFQVVRSLDGFSINKADFLVVKQSSLNMDGVVKKIVLKKLNVFFPLKIQTK